MKILLHSCCGPCTIFPLKYLRDQEAINQVEVLFYNPNIHPFIEYRNRLNSLKEYLSEEKISLHLPFDYELKTFFRKVVHNEEIRCNLCYDIRLEFLVEYAKEQGFDGFTTTLLYSKYQNHAYLKSRSQKLADLNGLEFFYSDFREGWQEGIDASIIMGMYRQKYCGCLYSEQERFDNRWKKKNRKKKLG